MGKWTSSPHPISDIRDWKRDGKLEIQPDFQRRAVWSEQAKILLIDSILKGIPMPKLFIAQKIKDDQTYRVVIDGQQRISAILDFLDNKFSLNKPYKGDHENQYFKDLDEETQNDFLLYNLDFNIINGYSDDEIREMYHRVNKYNVALNKQELRRADFPGDFLKISEELSSIAYFEEARLFTTANRRRLGDVEYTSELLAILLDGPQDKKESLDSFYIDYADWDTESLDDVKSRFYAIIDDLKKIFNEDYPIHNTRFRQKADFYSIFLAIGEMHQENLSEDAPLLDAFATTAKMHIHEDLLPHLQCDLEVINDAVEPSAPGKYGEYAVRCVSDANMLSSRKWRADFLKKILLGAYDPYNPNLERLEFLESLITCWDEGMCPQGNADCEFCEEFIQEYGNGVVRFWPKGKVFLETAHFSHKACLEKEADSFVWLDN